MYFIAEQYGVFISIKSLEKENMTDSRNELYNYAANDAN